MHRIDQSSTKASNPGAAASSLSSKRATIATIPKDYRPRQRDWLAAENMAGLGLSSPDGSGVIRPIASSLEAVVAQGQRSPPTGMADQADVIR
jgi:hypothetical protein